MTSDEHPYLRIADELRRRVAEGEWQVGDRLPSRAQLAADYGVGANVLQRAQETLIAEGLLEGRTGSGTYVRVPTERRRMLRSRRLGPQAAPPFLANTGDAGVAGTWESQSHAGTPAPDGIAARLGIEPGDGTVRTCYEFLVDAQPVQLVESWEPLAITKGSPVMLPELGPLAHQGVVRRMAAIGITVDYAVESPRPARATQQQALLLGISAGDLVTVVERTFFDIDGRPVETADMVVPDSRWQISYELPVERP